MLGKIFGSNTRVKILKLFLLHPENKFYIRQISRGLKLQLNSVRRELENLEKFGILISVNIANDDEAEEQTLNKHLLNKKYFAKATDSKQEKKYYQANTDFVLYEEFKALIVKAQILYERDFINKLIKAGRPKLVIFTGLFVNNPEAPVDILLVGRFNKRKLVRLIKELEVELSKEINYTIMGTQEFKYRRDITDVFLYDILGGKKIVIVDELGIC